MFWHVSDRWSSYRSSSEQACLGTWSLSLACIASDCHKLVSQLLFFSSLLLSIPVSVLHCSERAANTMLNRSQHPWTLSFQCKIAKAPAQSDRGIAQRF